MDKYRILRTKSVNAEESFTGTHVTFRLAQRGQQIIGYTPPSWISRDPKSKEYLLRISLDTLDHQHPYALE